MLLWVKISHVSMRLRPDLHLGRLFENQRQRKEYKTVEGNFIFEEKDSFYTKDELQYVMLCTVFPEMCPICQLLNFFFFTAGSSSSSLSLSYSLFSGKI
jgi:hypothetical protein